MYTFGQVDRKTYIIRTNYSITTDAKRPPKVREKSTNIHKKPNNAHEKPNMDTKNKDNAHPVGWAKIHTIAPWG